MRTAPVQLVLQKAPPEALVATLRAAGLGYEWVPPSNAADAVNRGLAKLVVCELVPGWQALVARVEAAGGGCVIWGPPPSEEDRRGYLSLPLEAVADEKDLIIALARTEARLWSARPSPQGEDDLLERAKTAERISKFAQSIASQIELPGVMGEAIARTRDLCDACGTSLLLVDPSTGELCFHTVVGDASDAIESIRLKPGQGIAGKVAQTAEPILVKNVHQSVDFFQGCDDKSGFITGSIIAAPLLLSGDVLGVLEAVRGHTRPNFDEIHLRRLVALAPHVTIAVHNAQMNARLRHSQAQVMQANSDLERKVVERTAQIARGKEEWERTFDAISEPIAIQDGFILKRANQAYAKRAGIHITELLGKTCYRALAGRDNPCPQCPLLREGTGQLTGEIIFEKSNYEFSGFWLSPSEEDQGVVVHYRDISEQRSLQSRLRESERMAALGQLASGAAHEINNPIGFVASNLGTLKGWLEDVRSSPPEPAELHSLLEDSSAIIEESLTGTQRVSEIVKALRELSRLEFEQPVPASPQASISRIVRQVFGENSTVAEVSSQAEVQVSMPPLQLDQVLSHLLKNAHQAVFEGQKVYVKTTADETEVQIEIRDEGCGISPENLHRIFEPFFSTRGIGKGVGLGLTAAYGIVQRHGGAIDVQSIPGRGSTFIIRLPRA